MNSPFPAATLITDLQGTEITAEERQWLSSPHLGGLIFFTRNFQSKEQIAQLIAEVKSINPSLLMTIDHEGGRVQRFRDGFTQVPSMRRIGALAKSNLEMAKECAEAAGVVLGYELQQIGVDLTYAPVLDFDYGHNEVIGERSFGSTPDLVSNLGERLMDGLKSLNMAVVAKHFPGHGWVKGDSHLVSPVDERPLKTIRQADMQPFVRLMDKINWIMPAHIVFKNVADDPAGYSSFWLQDVLRNELNFNGPIVSDDLSMEGAAIKGGYSDRANAAMKAGCNILLACNSSQASVELLSWLESNQVPNLNLSDYQPNLDLDIVSGRYEQALNLLKQHQLI